MKLIHSKLNGVIIIEPNIFTDNRGFFMESFNEKLYFQAGLNYRIVQDNHSLSVEPGVIRGLHYQLNPKAQTKIVRVVTGAIYDVVVDIRKSSPTFGDWVGVILSEYNKRQLVVPIGFAHGFCSLVPNTNVLYKVDEYYSAEHERGIYWKDPDLCIEWPVSEPILSKKDREYPLLKDAEINFE